MNRLTKSLLVGLLEQENYTTAFYGGGFKPPTKGHFAVVKKSLEQFPDIDKFYIVIGKGIRDGISQDESYSVWNIYKKYLGDKIEIIKADSSPLKYVKDYIKENTNHKSLVLIGSREESDEDAQDFVKRKEFFDQYGSHVEVKNIITSGGVSGTKAREAAKISKEQFFQYVPSELTDEEKNLIFTYVQSVIQEQAIKKVANKAKELGKNFSQAFKDQKGDFKGFRSLVLRHLTKQNLTPEEKEKLKRNLIDILKTSGIAITFPVLGASGNVLLGWLTSKLTKGKFTTLPSKFKDQLLDHQILEILSGINLTQPLNENATYSSSIDYKQKIVDLTNYMRKKGYKIDPLPKVEFKNGDEENAKNFFGKTAYYDPNTMTIYLYTEGRHPKDIVRSFSHEMIHHIQNLEDRLGNITTQNTSEDDHLDRIEREAYLNGNITFRNWTDSLNENVSPFSMDIKESILSDIKEYGNILEFQIDLTNTYQYSFNSNVGEFYDDINNVKVIVKLKPTTKNIPEFKFYSLQDDNQVSFNKLKHYNPKVMNTIFKIFMDKVLPENPKVLIQPFDYLRYRLFRAMLNNNLDGKNYKVDTKDDPMGQSILLVQKLNESKKPYKHKHGFDDKLGKDPFGLNQFAREIMQEDSLLKEGRYDKLTNQISSKIFNYWKNNLDPTIDIDEEQVVEYKFPITFQNLTFDVETKLILDPGVDKFEILDSTGAGTDKGGDFINVHFRTDPERLPKEWEFISMMIKDVIRHEIEHLTHNVGAKSNIKLKSLEDDSLIRKAIKAKLLPQAEYFKLTKEIDAMLQGMYFRAKKSKQPFSKVLSDYLDIQDITSKEKQEILQLWSKRSQELNLPSVLQENLDPSQITIYLDMDGVIADFDQRFQSLSGMDPTEFENTYGKQEFWDFIDEKHKIAFWVGIPVMGGAQQLVDYVSKYPYEILTAPSTKKQSLLGKNLWVKNHIDLFGSKPKINFKKAKNKHLVKPNLTKNDILIDDRADTIDRWNTAGGTGILYKSSSQVINDMKKLGL
jgi:PAS domain-containing protein